MSSHQNRANWQGCLGPAQLRGGLCLQDESGDTAKASTQAQYGGSSGEKSVVSPAQPVAAAQPTAASPQPGFDRRLHSVWVDIIETSELKFGRRLGEQMQWLTTGGSLAAACSLELPREGQVKGCSTATHRLTVANGRSAGMHHQAVLGFLHSTRSSVQPAVHWKVAPQVCSHFATERWSACWVNPTSNAD